MPERSAGKENTSTAPKVAVKTPASTTEACTTASTPSTAEKVPKDYGRVDLVPFFDSPLVGGPLSEVSIDEPNKKKRNKKNKDKGKKKEREGKKDEEGRRGSMWAGSAFLKSPAPEELPMPSAALLAGLPVACADTAAEDLKKMLNVEAGCAAADERNDAVATDELRRMLLLPGAGS